VPKSIPFLLHFNYVLKKYLQKEKPGRAISYRYKSGRSVHGAACHGPGVGLRSKRRNDPAPVLNLAVDVSVSWTLVVVRALFQGDPCKVH
jgi:hypothetical protein